MDQSYKEITPIMDENQELVLSNLPKAKGWLGPSIYEYQGFWCPSMFMKNIIPFQNHFNSHHEDVILGTFPKSGTTWLKAIIFSIINRNRYTLSTTPLLTTNPHRLVPFFESDVYALENGIPDLSSITIPRIFATHIPYDSLPESMRSTKCKIIYLCRNPLDMIVSFWHFASKINFQDNSERSIGELVDSYSNGEVEFGPFWEHMLGYWRESLARPEKVLFLKFEDLKEDSYLHIKKLASFIGYPFSVEEETKGVIEDIAHLCSFSNLKEMEVNKIGKFLDVMDNKTLFRKGEVGDWVNHLTPSMVEKINKVVQEKLNGSGLTFNMSN